jgi:exosome complex component RRP43
VLVERIGVGTAQGQAAWIVYVDVVCLAADGSLFDAALLAAVGALRTLELPSVQVSDDGKVCVAPHGATPDARQGAGTVQPAVHGGRLEMHKLPVALTCGLWKGKILADPCEVEESMMDAFVTVTMDSQGSLVRPPRPSADNTMASHSALNCASSASVLSCLLDCRSALSRSSPCTSREGWQAQATRR